jgi:hypothetical protein
MAERARQRRHFFPDADFVRLALRRRARCIDLFRGHDEFAADRDLESQFEAMVILQFDRAVGQARHPTVPGKLRFDRVEILGGAHAIDLLAQHVRRRQRRRQRRIGLVADDDACAVQRLEQAAGSGNVRRLQAEGSQVLTTGGDIVDAEDEIIRPDDVHGTFLSIPMS